MFTPLCAILFLLSISTYSTTPVASVYLSWHAHALDALAQHHPQPNSAEQNIINQLAQLQKEDPELVRKLKDLNKAVRQLTSVSDISVQLQWGIDALLWALDFEQSGLNVTVDALTATLTYLIHMYPFLSPSP